MMKEEKREESHKMSEDQYYYNDPNYLGISPLPDKPDDNRESSTSGYHSFPRPPRGTNPREESPIPDTEPISVSEFSDAHAVPLFRTPPPTKRRTSSQKDQKVSDDDDFDKQSYV
ncbi:hypothetical protein B9Z55_006125 [Caenorhabditis nigoni]|nr:hypothetical protein B9Z55_006125 [Caenorhabditis nigoni]